MSTAATTAEERSSDNAIAEEERPVIRPSAWHRLRQNPLSVFGLVI
jgi:hypothetical protein